jgi:hypothetical protein
MAYLLDAGGHTVVTHEKAQPLAKKIKIPNVCIGLNIKCMTPFEMLRNERARFVLRPTQRLSGPGTPLDQ